MMMRCKQFDGFSLAFSDEVSEALDGGRPLVALESNVITHGLQYPDNVATARKVEDAVRAGGSIPATIGIDAGRIMIGMTGADIERFASTPGIPKVSSRDMPVVLASGGMGATTVASSVVAADLAGIPFFASAGIGGVHRGAERTMDVSSDLIQFTRSKVAVVCAGAKSILDLGLTMEYLETHCVPVVSFRSDDFPAFYCVSSGFRSPHRLDDEALIARAVACHWALGHHSSFLIASPIKEADAIDGKEVDAVIARATAAAERDGVRGNALTKYLMRAVDKATEGRSAQANMSVLISTAELAGRLAAAYAEQRRGSLSRSKRGAGGDAGTRAVIFDLDGTLIDTPRAIVETFAATFAAMGVTARDPAVIRATIGLPLERAFSQLLEVSLDDDRVAHCVERYQVLFRELILPQARSLIFPGVAEGLETLRGQGFALAVATSKFYASADALLRAAGLREHFSVVVGADQVTQPKPAPEMGRLIMDRLGVSAERAVMVGDTTHDLLMASAAGMRSVAVTYGIHSVQELRSSAPTWMADTFHDVLTCVQRGLLATGGPPS
jgi:pseudouridine-5'-phosphate glycosidase